MNDREAQRLDWVEHLGKACESFVQEMKGVLPEEAYKHLRASRKEFLLAVRSLIDRRIERLEKEPQKRARRVEVQ